MVGPRFRLGLLALALLVPALGCSPTGPASRATSSSRPETTGASEKGTQPKPPNPDRG
jgi:hypothetical protein